jgi:hypothetical protein
MSYKIDEIDYSKNDQIDINNRLSRIGRNNMSENKTPIRDLDDDAKAKGEKNLLLYGSELINNLKQINYTFQQIERYVFIKSKITKKTIKKVIEEGPKSTVKDIREPIEEEITAIDDLPELEGVRDFMKYEFINKELDFELAEYEEYLRKLEDEYQKIEEQFIILMSDEEVEYDEINEKGSPYLKDMKEYINHLLEEGNFLEVKIAYEKDKLARLKEPDEEPEVNPEDIGKKITKLQSLVRGKKGKKELEKLKRIAKRYKDEEEEKEKKLRKEIKSEKYEQRYMRKEDEGLSDEEPDVEEQIPKDLKIPPFGADTSDVREFLDINQVTGAKRAFKNMGFESRTINKLSLNQIRQIIEAYDQGKVVGAGRYRGGAKKRGRPAKAKAKAEPEVKAEAKAEAKAEPEPKADNDGELELIDEIDPKKEAEDNEEVADEVDSSLVEVSNMKDTTPSQTYISKANELMINLIQFIGRTTVLYITRIDKNINYLDEDQVKLIFDYASQLKPNLDMLQYYKNLGGALIKETIYKQLTSETNTLYNKINDNIRNYKKLTNYTIFSGAGMNKYKGGYFIQSDNPFIRHSITKRFL